MNKINIENNNNKCIICHNIPFHPVTTNKWQLKGKNSNKKIEFIGKCQSSIKNMNCEACVREHVEQCNKKNKGKYDCPNGCCRGLDIPRRFNMIYGSKHRNSDEETEPEIWPILYSNDLLNKKCNKCNYLCKNYRELINHNITKCPERKISCITCKTWIKYSDLDKHKSICNNAIFKIYVDS